MQDLSIYLKKFSIMIGDKADEKRVIQNALLHICNITLAPEAIDVKKEGKIQLVLSPLEKSEIHMKRKAILQKMKEGGLVATRIG